MKPEYQWICGNRLLGSPQLFEDSVFQKNLTLKHRFLRIICLRRPMDVFNSEDNLFCRRGGIF